MKPLQNLCAALALGAVAGAAAAQSWPAKPVRILVHFPAAGATDAVARILAQPLSAALGQPVLVENKPGADGVIAGGEVLKAPADGYTLLLASQTAMLQVPLLKKNPPWDSTRDFTPIGLVGNYVFVFVADPHLPFRSGAEMVRYARTNPGKLNFGTYSSGGQLFLNQLKQSGLDLVQIPYKGEAPTIVDILGGRTQLTIATPTSSLQHIRAGKLTALAVLLPTRHALMPEVPTTVEAGLPPLSVATWAALFGPAGLPREVVARLNRELNAAIARPEIREQVDRQGFQLQSSTPEELGAYVKSQLGAWKAAFDAAGMKPE
ncbi:MAG TPA: tripartite tricarboxylate transporter substrate binding protein [Burkholderiales bacterium]|nr:tripartite tricarboxylate transporter substrate binding protein [Burkholderiales bacterium]